MNNKIIATIAIISHGKIIALNNTLSENSRLYSLAAPFDSFDNAKATLSFTNTHQYIQNLFRKDLKQDTFDIIKQYTEYSKDKYKNFCGQDTGYIYQPIPFDKLYTIENNFFDHLFRSHYMGFFLISLHTQNTLDGPLTLIYPLPQHNQNIDLSNSQHIHLLYQYIHNTNIDTHTSNIIQNINLNPLKLSQILQLLHHIIGQNSFINVLDYSCNNVQTDTINQNIIESNKQFIKPNDIETGYPRNFGGKTKKKNYKKDKKNKTKKN